MGKQEDEIRNAQFKAATGSAPSFTAIDGIGQKTAKKLRNIRDVRAPADVEDYSQEELSEEAGISESRAAKAIRGAGGRPAISNRGTTGSVSAAGIKTTQGEFRVEFTALDKANARFDTSLNRGIGRSQEAARADKSKRAPITTDYDQWKENKGEVDFPGVDTPTDNPKVQRKDREFINEDDTTLETRTGSLFLRENNISGGTTPSFKGLRSGGSGLSRATTETATAVAADDVGFDPDEPAGGDAVADVTFFQREQEGEVFDELVPFMGEESDRSSFEF
jgi:hypothetical protein